MEAENAFRMQIDGAKPAGLWQGEFWGKHVLSAVEVCRYTGDESLKQFLHSAALRLLSLAREDGYLNTYADSLNVFPPKPGEAKFLWNWNIWCRKYTLWGLIAVYDLTRDEAILTGVLAGLPSCSILKPLLLLFRRTNDTRILDFCIHDIADNWEREDGACPNLITNALSGRRISDWYPEPQMWAKAYEMMSCFEGLCELYRVTGVDRYLEAAKRFYDILVRYELNPLFSVAYNDMFADAAEEITAVSEPCDSIHFMRLCYELYCLTGDRKYMDSFEMTFYNAFLAGVFADGEWGSRAVRGAGRHMWTRPQAKMEHHHCCVDNMARGLLRYAEAAVMDLDNAVAVNLYEECSALLHFEDGACRVQISGGYFTGRPVTVTACFEGTPRKLLLRIPAWCTAPAIRCADAAVIRNGVCEITPTGDTCTAEIDFRMTPVIRTLVPAVTRSETDRWYQDRWTSHYASGDADEDLFRLTTRHTLCFDPLLLARTKKLGSTEEDIFTPAIGENTACRLTPMDASSVRAAFLADFSDGETRFTVPVCDYASAANAILDDKRYFSTYF